MPKLCEFENCRGQASYGEYYGKPIRCKNHKEEYKLVSRLCQESNCKTLSTYNYEGETKARFCSSHKEIGMIDVISKKCEHDGCQKHPKFNYIGESRPRFCSSHKEIGMIDIISKKCEHDGCKKTPSYNYSSETTVRFCGCHKFENMVDVKNKRCEHSGCQKQPTYNYEGESNPRFCGCHKFENMIDVKNKKCERDGCQKQPNYNYEGESIPRFCNSHKEFGMIDIKNKRCKSNLCLGTFANVKYKGYCASCYQRLFPNDPLTYQIRSKTKEIAVRDYINSNFDDFHHDRPLWTGNCDCTHRRRIDHRKLIGNTLLCIETDENQHGSYDKTDEEIRYDDLMMLHGGKFVYIRFNPDKYKDKNGKSINPMLYTRLPVLHKEIEKQINRIENEENTELLEIIKLYYNE
jgi:hypothetical protein